MNYQELDELLGMFARWKDDYQSSEMAIAVYNTLNEEDRNYIAKQRFNSYKDVWKSVEEAKYSLDSFCNRNKII